MEGSILHYSEFFDRFTSSPDLAKFRRHTEYMCWSMYLQCADIQQLRDECDADLRKIPGFEGREKAFTITDLTHTQIRSFPKALKMKIKRFQKILRQYHKNLCNAHTISQLPDQPKIFSESFARDKGLFKDEKFVLTGESEIFYTHPLHPDICCLNDMGDQDSLTSFFINNVQALVRWFSKKKVIDGEAQYGGPEKIPLNYICTGLNVVSCLHASLMFTVAMTILHSIRSRSAQIVVQGLLGVAVMLTVLMVVKLKRRDIFTIMAAYYAITGVIIATNSSKSC